MSGSDPFTPTPDSPFAHGPYTTTPDPLTGPDTSTLPAIPRRDVRTLIVVALGILFLGCFLGAFGYGSATEQPPKRESLPLCELEDGSTQKACIFPSERGAIVNLDYGRYSYDTTNNIVFDHGKGYGR
jgi:hypothetical protein